MTIEMRQVNPTGTRVFMGTITDGVNVHEALAEVVVQHNIQTATFEMLGGLHEVELTAYDFVHQVRLEPIVLQRPLEIIAGHGTISLLEGQPHFHMHLAVSFRDEVAPYGIAVVGGHAARATAFAIEFTLTAYDGDPVHRAVHPSTGLKLWDLS